MGAGKKQQPGDKVPFSTFIFQNPHFRLIFNRSFQEMGTLKINSTELGRKVSFSSQVLFSMSLNKEERHCFP